MNFSDYRNRHYFAQSFSPETDAEFWTDVMPTNQSSKKKEWEFKGKISYEDYVFAEIDENNFFDDFQPAEREQPRKEQNSVEEILILCSFCSESFGIKEYETHDEVCTQKKVLCEECGQNILINAFGLHIEICKPQIPDDIIFEQAFTVKNPLC